MTTPADKILRFPTPSERLMREAREAAKKLPPAPPVPPTRPAA